VPVHGNRSQHKRALSIGTAVLEDRQRSWNGGGEGVSTPARHCALTPLLLY
jgi:hypothetical protein